MMNRVRKPTHWKISCGYSSLSYWVRTKNEWGRKSEKDKKYTLNSSLDIYTHAAFIAHWISSECSLNRMWPFSRLFLHSTPFALSFHPDILALFASSVVCPGLLPHFFIFNFSQNSRVIHFIAPFATAIHINQFSFYLYILFNAMCSICRTITNWWLARMRFNRIRKFELNEHSRSQFTSINILIAHGDWFIFIMMKANLVDEQVTLVEWVDGMPPWWCEKDELAITCGEMVVWTRRIPARITFPLVLYLRINKIRSSRCESWSFPNELSTLAPVWCHWRWRDAHSTFFYVCVCETQWECVQFTHFVHTFALPSFPLIFHAI